MPRYVVHFLVTSLKFGLIAMATISLCISLSIPDLDQASVSGEQLSCFVELPDPRNGESVLIMGRQGPDVALSDAIQIPLLLFTQQ